MPEEMQEQIVQEQQGEVVQEQGEGQQPGGMLTPQEPQEGLPEEVSERTKREFEKLKEHNRQMAEELKALKGPPRPGLLDSYGMGQYTPPVAPQVPQVQPQSYLPTATVEQIKQDVVDSEGYLNQAELERRLSSASQAEERARLAEEKAQQALEKVARFEANTQARDLYASYPELDPSHPQFNEEAYELVQGELLKQLVNRGSQNAIEAAHKMSRYFRKPQVTPAQRETLQARSQQSAVVQAKPAPLSADQDLVRRSLHDESAMDERIRLAGI